MSRYFDNEDYLNQNYVTGGSIWPSSQSSSGTRLKMCVFLPTNALVKCSADSPVGSFPELGFSYGVFGVPNLPGALASGSIYTDDENSGNNNSWNLSGLSSWEQDRVREFMYGGSNTMLKTVRAR